MRRGQRSLQCRHIARAVHYYDDDNHHDVDDDDDHAGISVDVDVDDDHDAATRVAIPVKLWHVCSYTERGLDDAGSHVYCQH